MRTSHEQEEKKVQFVSFESCARSQLVIIERLGETDRVQLTDSLKTELHLKTAFLPPVWPQRSW